jgi:hypothetical protein
MKRRADAITRSQYEIYSLSTKYNLPEAATDELLAMLSNVSADDSIGAHSLTVIAVKVRFRPEDILHKTMKTMDHAAKLAMMPDFEMYSVDLHEGKIH